MGSCANITDLPPEITLSIFSFLPARALSRVACVCRAWQTAVDSPDGVQLWRGLLATTVGIDARIDADWTRKEGESQIGLKTQLNALKSACAIRELLVLPSDFINSSQVVEHREDCVVQVAQDHHHLTADRALRSDLPFPCNNVEFIPYIIPPPCSESPLPVPEVNPRTPRQLVFLPYCYFEVSILPNSSTRTSERDCLAVGLGKEAFPMIGKQPGWTRDSVGYHSDDGHRFHGAGFGEPYAPGFGPGDTVGCGFIMSTGRVFFTLNGVNQGISHDLGTDFPYYPLFPVIGLSLASAIQFNFGERPFRYDVRADDLVRKGSGEIFESAMLKRWMPSNIIALHQFYLGEDISTQGESHEPSAGSDTVSGAGMDTDHDAAWASVRQSVQSLFEDVDIPEPPSDMPSDFSEPDSNEESETDEDHSEEEEGSEDLGESDEDAILVEEQAGGPLMDQLTTLIQSLEELAELSQEVGPEEEAEINAVMTDFMHRFETLGPNTVGPLVLEAEAACRRAREAAYGHGRGRGWGRGRGRGGVPVRGRARGGA